MRTRLESPWTPQPCMRLYIKLFAQSNEFYCSTAQGFIGLEMLQAQLVTSVRRTVKCRCVYSRCVCACLCVCVCVWGGRLFLCVFKGVLCVHVCVYLSSLNFIISVLVSYYTNREFTAWDHTHTCTSTETTSINTLKKTLTDQYFVGEHD